ncbi:MAG: hypothetical protein GY694_02535 [Gammaproteobacteria bacterium]|nr:hypothetical protein [Gammaproteobacteria bacterium]
MSYKINAIATGLILISLTTVSLASNSFKQQRGERLAQELNLTSEQQEEVKSIMQEQRKEAQAWRKQHQEETKNKLSKVLNNEQMEKFETMKKQRAEKRQMRKKDRRGQ